MPKKKANLLDYEGIGSTKQVIAEMLENTILSHVFTWKEIQTLTRYIHPLEFEDKKVIFKEGDTGTDMYLVAQGAIDIYKESSAGKHVRVANIRKGNPLGEMSIVDGLPRSASAVAKGHTTLLVLSKDNLDALLKDHHGVGIKMLMMLAKLISLRLRKTSGVLIESYKSFKETLKNDGKK